MKSNQEILYQYYSPKTKSIFGYMYGSRTINDEIIEINKSDLTLGKNGDCFIYVWGFPGPDVNIYDFKEYGETWAFSKDEIKE